MGRLGRKNPKKTPIKQIGTFSGKKTPQPTLPDCGQGISAASPLAPNDPKRHSFRLSDKNKQILFS